MRPGDPSDTSAPPSNDASFRQRLAGEVEQWQQEGLVRPDQARGLLARYGLLLGEAQHTVRRSRIVGIVSVLGVVLIGTGVILFVGANWQHLPKEFRLALLLAATAVSYASGYRMAFQTRTYPKVGTALLLLGSLLWGASIFLVGQMYHMGSRSGGRGETEAVFYWFAGVLPLAYVIRSPLHLTLSLVTGSIWLSMAMTAMHRPSLHTFPFVAFALGIVFYVLSRLHFQTASARRLEAPYRWFGLIYLFVPLYVYSFRHSWSTSLGGFWYPHHTGAHQQAAVALSLLLAPGAVAILALFYTKRPDDRIRVYESLALFGLLLVVVLVLVITYDPSWLGVDARSAARYESPGALLLAGLFNLILLAGAVGAIALGWTRNEPGMANLGIFVFFVQVVTRYFDLLGNMLSSSLMFIGAGLLLLLGGAALERSRRRLLEAMALRRAS
jgi:uncharacterized membrane protein